VLPARLTADRRTAARSTSAPAAASGGSSSPAAAGRSPASTTSRRPGGAPASASATRASRSSSCAATSRRCARPGSAPVTGCCSTPELPSGTSRRRRGGRARGKCLVRFALTEPGRVAVQHAAAVVAPVGGQVHVGISIVTAPGSADRASRTSSEAPASPRTASTIWQSSSRRGAASCEADHIARHPRAVRAWDRRCGRMVS
jgi:hypothetical protein